MSLALILPTIKGREERYDETLTAYRESIGSYPVEIISPVDYPRVSIAWNKGVQALRSEPQYLHFAIDDQVPDEGWLETAIETVETRPDWGTGFLPAADQRYPDGSHDSHGGLGFGHSLSAEAVDWTPCRTTGIPFCSWDAWQRIGDFHPAIHLFTDDEWFWRAATLGHRVVYREGYAFTHYHLKLRRVTSKVEEHRDVFLDSASRIGSIHHSQETR